MACQEFFCGFFSVENRKSDNPEIHLNPNGLFVLTLPEEPPGSLIR
jgi:hypothetical protein